MYQIYQWFGTPGLVLAILYLTLMGFTAFAIISEKRDPVKALSWITVIVLIPIIGFLLYLTFGRNHRKQRIFSSKEIEDMNDLSAMTSRQLTEINDPENINISHSDEDAEMMTLLQNNSRSILTTKNRLKVLHNGQQTFSEMKNALKKAEKFIHMEYYIMSDDKIGTEICEILKQKAAEGLHVRVIYDDVGSWSLSNRFVQDIRRSGIEIYSFMPVVFPWFTSRINYRNHRKILVIDGNVGFTGGINIADRYITGGRHFKFWRDIHLMIEGDAVKSLQSIFIADWHFVSKKKLANLQEYFPATRIKSYTPVQIVASGPDAHWSSIMQAYFAGITKAKHHIYIATPYFLPNEAILTAIKVASLSGIDVRLMIPSKSDSKIVYWATRSYVSELLEASVKVYLYHKGFNHTKAIMIDGVFSSLGSTNMDIRSFEDNFEVSAFIYDKEFTQSLEKSFLEDLEDSYYVTHEYWSGRGYRKHIYEAFARLFSPLL